jgi:hypothetical protein
MSILYRKDEVQERCAMGEKSGIGRMTLPFGIIVLLAIGAVAYLGYGAFDSKPGSSSASSAISVSSASQSPTPSKTTMSITTTESTCANGNILEGTGISWPPCGCGLVNSTSVGALYLQPNPSVGDYICLAAAMNDTQTVGLTVLNSNGTAVFSGQCVATGGASGAAVAGDSCVALWDTTKPDSAGNAIAPGSYELVATGNGDITANFTLY